MIKVAFLGAGRMASAMLNGLLSKNHYEPGELACTSADDGTGEALAAKIGIHFTTDLDALLGEPQIVVLAFKPQQLEEITPAHADLTEGKLIISILAGAPISKLAEKFPKASNIVRAMPNTPGQIGAGITCFAPKVTPLNAAAQESVEKILGSLGPVIPLDEVHLDAVTAVSGSGPAYLFEFVAALRDGGIAAGLTNDVAYKLALETTLGAARLLARTGETPETLRDWVSSPGGTTLAGLQVMENADFRKIINDTVLAAKKRSLELSQN